MKVKCLELVKAMERSGMNKTQLSFMICILKVRFYGVNRSHLLLISLVVPLCGFSQAWRGKRSWKYSENAGYFCKSHVSFEIVLLRLAQEKSV